MRQSRVPNRPTSRPRPPAISRWTPPRRCPMQPRQRQGDRAEHHGEGRRTQACRDRHRADDASPRLPPRRTPQDATPRPRPPRTACAATATAPAAEPVKAASNVPAGRSAGRRQTARNARRKIAALFRPQGRARRGREILQRARICAAMDASRQIDRQRQGRRRAPEGCRRRRPQSRRLSGAGFRRRHLARRSLPTPN